MDQKELIAEIRKLEEELLERKKKIRELRLKLQGEKVNNYVFLGPDETEIDLIQLFGDKRELIVIHNMGKGCAYCTLWADGFNSIYKHIADKAAFVLTSPDSPADQKQFAAERGWVFPMASTQNNTFREDFGFKAGGYDYPGVSVFIRDQDGTIYHFTKTTFEPGDEYCVVWSLFDLLPSGSDDYRPQIK